MLPPLSGFFIIVLIGFLVKDKRKNRRNSKQIKKLEETQTIETPVLESQVLVEPTNDIVSEIPILEQTDNMDNVVATVLETNMVLEEQKPINLMDAQPATQPFKVIYDNKPDTLDFGDHIILDQKALDEEVDIIDFSTLNAFESTNEIASPKD